MAKAYTPSFISGLSTDTKPTNVPTGTLFMESDTKLIYLFDGSGWIGINKATNTYISGSGVAGADNTAQTVVTISLPSNTLKQVNDRLRVRCYWKGDSGSPITGSVSLGSAGSEILIASTTDGGGATFQVTEAWLHYIDNTHANIISMAGGGINEAISNNNATGFSWNSTQQIIATQNQIGNNHITVYAIIVDIFPKGY